MQRKAIVMSSYLRQCSECGCWITAPTRCPCQFWEKYFPSREEFQDFLKSNHPFTRGQGTVWE